MINRAVLTGRLTDNLNINYTKSNQPMAVTNFRLAVNRRFKDANGERPADFINCVLWGKGAEILSKYAGKGSMIGIDGRIQTRNYENQQGQKVYVTEIVVENFTLLGGNNNQQNNQSSQPTQQDDGFPFNDSGNRDIDIDDSDLPF